MLIPLLPYCCAHVCLFPKLISLYYPVTFLNFDMFKCVLISNAYSLITLLLCICVLISNTYFPIYPVTFLNFDMFKCVLISNPYSLITLLPYCCAYVCLFPTLISLYYPVTFLNFDMFKCVYFQCLLPLLPCYLFDMFICVLISNAYFEFPYYPVTLLLCIYALIPNAYYPVIPF